MKQYHPHIFISILLMGISSLGSANVYDPDKPNLVIVMTDEHNIRTLGCYRDLLSDDQAFIWGKDVKVDTPNIDALASQSALFTQFYSTSPVCTPSRGVFLSGLYPNTTGTPSNHMPYHDDIITFGDVLEKEGYTTSYLGKWHLDGKAKPGFDISQEYGFEYDKYRFNRGHWKFMTRENGKVGVYTWKDKNLFQGRMERNYATDFLFDNTMDFIRDAVEENVPFAVMLSIPDPHGPNDVRPPYNRMFDDLIFDVPKTGIAAMKRNPSRPLFLDFPKFDFDLSQADDYIQSMRDDKKRQARMRNYFGMVKLIDDSMGKLLSTLSDLKLDDNTVVMFTADHGDLMDEHARNNKGNPYITSAVSPLIVRYPGHIQAGKVIDSAISSIDIFPTIMKVLDAKNDNTQKVLASLPGEASPELLDNDTGTSSKKNIIYMTSTSKGKWASAFDGRYKFVLAKNEPWLFDLVRDPDELINFISDPTYTDNLNELRDGLVDAMIKFNFSLPMVENIIYLDKPACVDSRDRLEIDPFRTCGDISPDDCSIDSVRNQCPLKCSLCCKDSKGSLLVDGSKILTCQNLWKSGQKLCKKYSLVQKFCPEKCGKCEYKTTSSTPSDIPTSTPSYLPTPDPTITTTSQEPTTTLPPTIVRVTAIPTPIPTTEPTGEPTAEPTLEPTFEPTMEPTIDVVNHE